MFNDAPETIWANTYVDGSGLDYTFSNSEPIIQGGAWVPYTRKDLSDKRIAELEEAVSDLMDQIDEEAQAKRIAQARNEALEEAAVYFRETRMAAHTASCARNEIPSAQVSILADLDTQSFIRALKTQQEKPHE